MTKDTRVSEILTELMREADIDDSRLARIIGIPVTSINRLRREPTSNPTISTLQPIANFFHISIDQLVGLSPLPAGKLPALHTSCDTATSLVPHINWQDISAWLACDKNVKPIRWLSSEKKLGEKSFSVKIDSESFEPIFQKSSIVLIDPECELCDSDFILIFNDTSNNDITIKQILKDGDDVYLRSLNPLFRKTTLVKSTVRVIGVIIEQRNEVAVDGNREKVRSTKNCSTAGVNTCQILSPA